MSLEHSTSDEGPGLRGQKEKAEGWKLWLVGWWAGGGGDIEKGSGGRKPKSLNVKSKIICVAYFNLQIKM